VLKKQMFENLKTEIFVDVEECWGHPQACGIDHPQVLLGLTWFHSHVKILTTKTSPTLFLWGLINSA
jgi:hypothetical protein